MKRPRKLSDHRVMLLPHMMAPAPTPEQNEPDAPPVHERLGAALYEAGLHVQARKAREGHYGDHSSHLVAPKLTLSLVLERHGTPAALALAQRVKRGEFDG